MLVLTGISCVDDKASYPNTPFRSCGEEFYYFENKPIHLKKSVDRATVGFNARINRNDAEQLLSAYSFVTSLDGFFMEEESSVAIISLEKDLSCAYLDQDLGKLALNERVSFTHCMFFREYRDIFIGIGDQFIVGLKSVRDTVVLRELTQQTRTRIVKPLDSQTYILRVNAGSTGNALYMANYFHDSGRFKYAEPDFINFGNLFD